FRGDRDDDPVLGTWKPKGPEPQVRTLCTDESLWSVHARPYAVVDRRGNDGVPVRASRSWSQECGLHHDVLSRSTRIPRRRACGSRVDAAWCLPESRNRTRRNGSQGKTTTSLGCGAAYTQVHAPRKCARSWAQAVPPATATLRELHARLSLLI